MAMSASALYVDVNDAYSTSENSGTQTLAADALHYVWIATANRNGGAVSGVSDDGAGSSWTEVETTEVTGGSVLGSWWRRTAGATGAGITVTASFSASFYVPGMVLVEVTADGTLAHVGGLDGTGTYYDNEAAPSVDCSARTSGNGILTGFAVQLNDQLSSPGSGWSELADAISASYIGAAKVQFHPTGDDTSVYTWASGVTTGIGIGVEFSETGGASPVPELGRGSPRGSVRGSVRGMAREGYELINGILRRPRLVVPVGINLQGA